HVRDSAAGDSGEDREDVAVGQLGVEAVEVTDVVVFFVDVHELVQPAGVVEQVAAQSGVLLDQLGEHLTDCRALDRHRGLAIGLGTQQVWELDLDGHTGRLQPDPTGRDSRYQSRSSTTEISARSSSRIRYASKTASW